MISSSKQDVDLPASACAKKKSVADNLEIADSKKNASSTNTTTNISINDTPEVVNKSDIDFLV